MELQPTQELAIAEHAQKLGVLATQLGYQGSLTVGALEDEIRFYQRRTVEACLELGKRLILLKELTPHGEFKQRTEMLNINERTAQRFISAALKFSKSDNLSLLKAAGNQSKLLELLVLDDEDIAELSDGGSVNGITLDDIDRMTASELRKKLREAKESNEALETIVSKKDDKINQLDTQVTKLSSPAQIKKRAESEPQQLEQAALETLSTESILFLTAFNRYTNAVGGVLDIASEKELAGLYDRVDEALAATCQRFAQYLQSLGVQIDFEEMLSPSWMFPEEHRSARAEIAEPTVEVE